MKKFFIAIGVIIGVMIGFNFNIANAIKSDISKEQINVEKPNNLKIQSSKELNPSISKIFIDKLGNSSQYNTYANDLNMIPDVILNKLVDKYTISLVNYTPDELKKYGINKDLAGAFLTTHNVAFVEPNLEYGALHETCHAIDTIFSGSNFGYSRTNEFKTIFNQEKMNVNMNFYFQSSVEEYFAQTLTFYFIDKTKLANAPKTIAYFDNLMSNLSK